MGRKTESLPQVVHLVDNECFVVYLNLCLEPTNKLGSKNKDCLPACKIQNTLLYTDPTDYGFLAWSHVISS